MDAALLADPVELALPDGFLYTASCDEIGEVTEYTPDGCILAGSYRLSGFRHDLLETVHLPAGGGTMWAKGTAPDMECRITCTVGTAADSYLMAGILWVSVKAGDRPGAGRHQPKGYPQRRKHTEPDRPDPVAAVGPREERADRARRFNRRILSRVVVR